jgi:DNA-binding transcriptional LysR family regulator
MRGPGLPSIDQLTVFLSVVETGSFAAAGRKIGRATSAISYTIAHLELQLGLPLFDRDRTRKPTLTKAGAAVLSEARTVRVGVDNLRAKVRGLLEGLEPEVALVVDVMLPTSRLVDAMQAFGTAFPTVALRLHVEALGAVAQLVHSGVAHIGIREPRHGNVPGLERVRIGGVDLIPVAAPDHPLALCSTNAPGAARNHTQLVLTDRSSLTEGHDFGVMGARSWRLADLDAKHALLLAGVGWGNMPEPIVRDDLAAGRLKRLDLPEGPGGLYHLEAMYRTDRPPGPAAAWMIQRFSDQANAVQSRRLPSPPCEHRPLVARGRDSHRGARAQRQS